MAWLNKQIFTVLAIRKLLLHVLQEIFNLLYFLIHLHHTLVFDFSLWFSRAPFQILTQVDNFGVERKSKEYFFFQTSIDFLDDEAIFANLQSEFNFFDFIL